MFADLLLCQATDVDDGHDDGSGDEKSEFCARASQLTFVRSERAEETQTHRYERRNTCYQCNQKLTKMNKKSTK